jgi:hypothetical protein
VQLLKEFTAMTQIRFTSLLSALTLSASLAPTATANAGPVQQVEITYQSTIVNDGHDTTGVFGIPATPLQGASFVAKILVDFTVEADRIIGVNSDNLIGGPMVGLPMPVVKATLFIDGRPASFPLLGHVVMGAHEVLPGIGNFSVWLQYALAPGEQNLLSIGVASPGIPFSLSTPFIASNVSGGGQFMFHSSSLIDGSFFRLASGQAERGTLSVAVVPEPGTYLLMALGMAMRCARSAATASTRWTCPTSWSS